MKKIYPDLSALSRIDEITFYASTEWNRYFRAEKEVTMCWYKLMSQNQRGDASRHQRSGHMSCSRGLLKGHCRTQLDITEIAVRKESGTSRRGEGSI